MRIVCVISTLQAGGAERVISNLSGHLVDAGHEIILVTLDSASATPFYSVHDGVRRQPLGNAPEGRGAWRFLRVLRWIYFLRRAIREIKPDVVISFIDLTNVMVLLAAHGLGAPVIASEHIDPHHYEIGRVGRVLRRLTYHRAARLTVLTKRAGRYFDWLPPSAIRIIPNAIGSVGDRAKPDIVGSNNRWRMIAVGRLSWQKGFDLLISAFARIAMRFPGWDLDIFGHGPDFESLSKQIVRDNMTGRITLAGLSQTIDAELRNSHVFVLSSRFEGFPLVLGEAMATGLPCVTFSDVSGVEDLIIDEVTGLVADSNANSEAAISSLAEKLARLMGSPELRSRLGEAAVERTKAYAPAGVFAMWDQLIVEVARHPTHV